MSQADVIMPGAGFVRSAARPVAARPRPGLAVRAGMLPWVPFWMALGIGGWFALPFQPGAAGCVAVALAGMGGLAAWPVLTRAALAGRLGWSAADGLRVATLALAVAAAGFCLAALRCWSVAAPVLDFRYYGAVEGRVVEIDRSARDRIRLTLDGVVLDGVDPGRTPDRVRVSLFVTDPMPVPGQRVMLTANLGPPPGPAEPGGFDFRRMAWFERLGAIGYSRTPVLTVEPPAPGGTLALHRLRMSLAETMRQRIGGQAGAVAAALMTGDRSGITESTNDIMRASNLYHIVSISGLHMSMLAGFVYAVLRLIGVGLQGAGLARGIATHKWAAAGALAAAAAYLWLSGGGVATERSFVMVAVMLIAIIADRRAISLRTVAVAGAIILTYSPEGLTSAGFQLSFAATVALILVQRPWSRLAARLPGWTRPAVLLVASSLVAGLATAPIAAAHFGRMTQYGMLANLLVVPVMGAVVMPAGVIAAVLGPLGLAGPALWFMGLGTSWMLAVAGWVSGLGGAVVLLPAPPGAVLPLAGIGTCLLLLAPVGGAGIARLVILRRLAGAGMVSLGILAWLVHHRPEVLVSAQGDAVAVMGSAGRVPSKPRGGAFTVAEWLEADGDAADQQMAAARPLWSGPPNARSATIGEGSTRRVLHHLTGKRARELAAELCRGGAILVADTDLRATLGARPDCTIIDAAALRRSGAVALRPGPERYSAVAANRPAADRPWGGPDPVPHRRRALPAAGG